MGNIRKSKTIVRWNLLIPTVLFIVMICILFAHPVYADETTTNEYVGKTTAELSLKPAVPFGETIYAYLGSVHNYYKMEIPSSGYLRIDTVSFSADQGLVISDSNGKTFPGTGHYTVGNKSSWVGLYLTPGTYTIHYSTNQYGAKYGDYNFKLTFTSSDVTYDFEKSSTAMVSSQDPIPLNMKIVDQISNNREWNYYKFVVPQSKSYNLHTNTTMGNFWMNIKDSSSNIVKGYDSWALGAKDKDSTLTLEAGTYYIVFYTGRIGQYSHGTYYFMITEKSDSKSQDKSGEENVSVKAPQKVHAKAGKKQIKISAKKSSKVSGFEICYKTGNSKWKVLTIKGNKNLNKSIKGLKHKTKYKIKIRSFVYSNNSKVYSSWSKTFTVKTK